MPDAVLILLAGAALLLLNGFFVLAEFAIVKVRGSRVEELVRAGHPRARLLQGIQQRLDEYLSVCQVGITLASVALGMVGELGAARLGAGDGSLSSYLLAAAFSYVLVSGSHIVLGELVPKSIAIRIADRAALAVALPLRGFHRLFFLPLWVLNRLAALCLRLLGFPGQAVEGGHSEGELRIILDRSQGRGLLSFRRLLFIENVFGLGRLRARDAMRPRVQVAVLDAGRGWPAAREVVRAQRLSRYPLVAGDPERPAGIVHLKDLLLRRDQAGDPDLAALARPFLTVAEDEPLEQVLAGMQHSRLSVALVRDAGGRWTGLLSFEDVVEEVVGTFHDEFERDEGPGIAEALAAGGIVLGVEAPSLAEAIPAVAARLPAGTLPPGAVEALCERERATGTYLGKGVAMPHARIEALERPLLVFANSRAGIPAAGGERAHLVFLLLTPAGAPRVHQRLQAAIAGLIEGSGFVADHLRAATAPEQAREALTAGEQATSA